MVAHHNDNSSCILATLKESKMGLRHTNAWYVRYVPDALVVLAEGVAERLERVHPHSGVTWWRWHHGCEEDKDILRP
jgi:hypothetical protein